MQRVAAVSIAVIAILVTSVGIAAAPTASPDNRAISVMHYPLPGPDEAPFPTGGKHGRFVTDGRYLYELGGDYSGNPGMQSGRSELWRLDTQSLVDGKPPQWERLVSYCGAGQTVMPGRPDEVPFAYDSRRKRLVMGADGFMYGNAGPCTEHPEMTGNGQWMEFDLSSGLWRKLPKPTGDHLTGRGSYHMQYDPVRDTMLRFGSHQLGVLNRGANVQTVYNAPPALRAQVGTMDIRKEYTALDAAGRWLYVLEPTHALLIRINLDDPSRWEWHKIPVPRLKYISGTARAVIYGQQMLAWTGDRVLGFSTWQDGPEPGPGSLRGSFRPWEWSETDGFHWLSDTDPNTGVRAYGNVGCWVPGVGFVSIGGFDDPATPVHENQYMSVMKIKGVVKSDAPPASKAEPKKQAQP